MGGIVNSVQSGQNGEIILGTVSAKDRLHT